VRVLEAARTVEVVAALLAAGAPLFPDALLCVKAARASADVCRALIAAGASVHAEDKLGHRPLHFASSAAVVEALIAAGADVNHCNAAHKSALQLTSPVHGDVTAALVAAGARADFSTDREALTPLHTARHPRGVQALIRAGATRDSSYLCCCRDCFFLVHRFHSISFTRAQGIPKYKDRVWEGKGFLL
jgi:ankyrin repeat protein